MVGITCHMLHVTCLMSLAAIDTAMDPPPSTSRLLWEHGGVGDGEVRGGGI